MKRKFITFILIALVVFTMGCETTKGLAVGAGTTVAETTQGVAKDTKNLWQAILKFNKAILKFDNWIKDNLW